MQAIIGYCVLAMIFIFAASETVKRSKGMQSKRNPLYKIIFAVFTFASIVVLCYVAIGCISGILWVIAWIGILIREIFQWLIEAILYPLLQLTR